ncbi:TPA: hypothetical protein ACOEEV_002048 [Enterobacter roggenkampii]
MDFTKFVSLISSGNLFHCRADKFRDPYEGTYPIKNRESDDLIFANVPKENRADIANQLYGHIKWARQWTYISCWHINEFESAAMWDLYARTEEAIAIETTYERLASSVSGDAYIGLVEYINYQEDYMPVDNAFYPYLFKRKSFEHEKEARVLFQELPIKKNDIDIPTRNECTGKAVKVNLDELIKSIRVSPSAPNWFYDLVDEVKNKYEITAPVVKSDLYNDPVL